MTLAQLISQLRGQMATKLEQRNKLAKDLAELRSAETVDEAKVTEIRGQKDALDAEVDALELRAKELEAEQSKDDEAIRKAREITPTEVRTPAYDQVARVGQEKRQYSPDTDKRGKGFLQDVVRSSFNDHGANERLARHMQEEQVERGQYLERATNTGAFAGLVVPQYLTDLYAPATAALRPFADICNTHELPASGMTVNISRITTASSVALQASENALVSETDMDDTLLTIPVQTAAGQQTISRQAIDRGTGIEDVTLSDLFRRYATALDSTLLNQATTGLSAVSQVTTYTPAGTPTAAEMYPKILGAGASIEAALLGQANPDYAIMHSRRWAWLQSQVGPNWPAFAQPNMDPQSMGVNKGVGYNKGVRGILPNGLLAIVDNNIATNLGVGTNQDEIYVVPSDECHLWEDPQAPVFIRAEQTKAANLGVLLVVYGYFAYTYARYTNGTAKIGGTGLVVPVF